ncbi:putative Chaperone protein DnaJ [Blattamonas nauphoetae]|uniref:Chaperone protein DnaJ n=1 Tax=Blattamonas nauphoetae TaxID=2049346 RepID=A0ABQ9XT69_9EUKA|nr:putative Chaperone protein DnaJ [Blattamonas nauphoetae]
MDHTLETRNPFRLLGLTEEHPTDHQIRTAYRKMALRYHPDKNLDDPETAADAFKKVQKAYELLSDPQQRKWYEDHRDEVDNDIDPEDDGDAMNFPIDVDALIAQGSSSLFSASPDGFCQLFGNAFREISKWNGTEGKDPEFGLSNASDASVKQFYSFWSSFKTKRTFSWKDQYDVRRAENRYVRRAMEKENLKERQKGRTEANANVSQLVSYVMGIDQRLIRIKAKDKKKEEERRAKAQKAVQKEKEREREKHRKIEDEAIAKGWFGWVSEDDFEGETEDEKEEEGINFQKKRNKKGGKNQKNKEKKKAKQPQKPEHSDEHESDDGPKDPEMGMSDDEDDDELSESDLTCDICNKAFKSLNQIENHLKSRKHKQNMKEEIERRQREKRQRQEETGDVSESEKSEDPDKGAKEEPKEETHPLKTDIDQEETSKQGEGEEEIIADSSDTSSPNGDNDPSIHDTLHHRRHSRGKRSRSSSSSRSSSQSSSKSQPTPLPSQPVPPSDDWVQKKPKKKQRNPKPKAKQVKSAKIEKVTISSSKPLNSTDIKTALSNAGLGEANVSVSVDIHSNKPKAKKTTHAEERIEKDSENDDDDDEKRPGEQATYNCETCGEVFKSRNALFSHLRKTKHAVYIPNEKEKSKKKRK